MATPTPFKIAVPDAELSWITERVKTARLVPPKELPEGKEWSYGPPASVAARLKEYWSTSYDWRKVEAKLNAELKQFTLPISVDDEDLTIHFVHHRSNAPDAIPLILPHGWPGNFLEVRHIIGELTDPKEEGQQAYHVVAPSLPGFGFSSYPKKPFNLGQIGTTFHKLMLALGYTKYIAQGGDWGSMIVQYMGKEFGPEHCVGVHVNFIIGGPPSLLRTPVTMARLVFAFTTGWGWGGEYANAMIKRQAWWRKEEAGYQQISSTKPLTVGASLNDSPMGMMLWIYDKMRLLVDDDFDWDDETIITWAMVSDLFSCKA
jgi:pimeloyl-ACP methyl ester carboxylesterase